MIISLFLTGFDNGYSSKHKQRYPPQIAWIILQQYLKTAHGQYCHKKYRPALPTENPYPIQLQMLMFFIHYSRFDTFSHLKPISALDQVQANFKAWFNLSHKFIPIHAEEPFLIYTIESTIGFHPK